MGSNGSGEKPPSSGGLDDTVPASEPPLDVDGNPMRMSRASIPPVPTQRYRMGVELGRGGMGRVVEAYDTQLGRTVALKEVLPKGASVARRFVREIEITARLEHASIVPIYDSGTTTDGRPFYVMRRVSGRPLDELIHGARGLDERLTLLPNLLAAFDAVAHAHSRGVIHRDLKPSNILVGKLGETVVIDWGLAKVIGESEDGDGMDAEPTPADSLQTQVGSVFGTPGFMPPEQARGEAPGTRGDVYALGATLYHLLAGIPPHAGGSATAVLGSTLKHAVKPLAEVAPGAPFELIAIADKAMGFEAATRYANAGELAEDMRRFLAGQLVAAHRYTSAERLKRFARRHRTVLAVAALATVAVAALAWFSVHRIVQERDAANVARQHALDEQRAAERARDTLADRNDALLLTQARAYLDTNPTEALAVLKQLPAGSSRIPEAKALAQAAVTRGAWWSLQSTDTLTFRADLAHDGRHLLQVSRDDMLRVWDLDTRRLVVIRQLHEQQTAMWVGSRILIYGGASDPALLFDIAANSTVPLGDSQISEVAVSAGGERMLDHDGGGIAFIDPATLVRTPLAPRSKVAPTLAIAADGSWAVVSDRVTTVAFDASGHELLRLKDPAQRVEIASSRKFAATLSADRIVECTLGAKPGCEDRVVPVVPRPIVVDLAYNGDDLVVMLGTGEVLVARGRDLITRQRIEQFTYRLGPAGADLIVVPSLTGKVLVLGASLETWLVLPNPVPHMRVITRRGSSRVVVVGDGQILVTDLANLLPRRMPNTLAMDGLFVDDTTLVGWKEPNLEWRWMNVDTGAASVLAIDRLIGLPVPTDVDGGRLLVREVFGDDRELLLFRKGSKPKLIGRGPRVWGRLLPGDAVVFGLGEVRPDGSVIPEARVSAMIGDHPPQEVVKLDGELLSAAALGQMRYVVLSDRGEIVRGDLLTGVIERGHIDVKDDSFVGADARGRPVIAVGERLYVWTTGFEEIARFSQPIRRTQIAVHDRLVVVLADHSASLTAVEPGARPERLIGPSMMPPAVSADGLTLVGAGSGTQLTVVELGSRARWTLLAVVRSFQRELTITPSTRLVAHSTGGGLLVWTLPLVSGDFHGWLDEQTNAVKRGDELLAWPWQVR